VDSIGVSHFVLLSEYDFLIPILLKAVPLKLGQGCIAGPKENWVGIYWVGPTLLYTASVCCFTRCLPIVADLFQFALALIRSIRSLEAKPLSPWKLMLRDGLNLYGVSAHRNDTGRVY
jgi:hypothetical protein